MAQTFQKEVDNMQDHLMHQAGQHRDGAFAGQQREEAISHGYDKYNTSKGFETSQVMMGNVNNSQYPPR